MINDEWLIIKDSRYVRCKTGDDVTGDDGVARRVRRVKDAAPYSIAVSRKHFEVE